MRTEPCPGEGALLVLWEQGPWGAGRLAPGRVPGRWAPAAPAVVAVQLQGRPLPGCGGVSSRVVRDPMAQVDPRTSNPVPCGDGRVSKRTVVLACGGRGARVKHPRPPCDEPWDSAPKARIPLGKTRHGVSRQVSWDSRFYEGPIRGPQAGNASQRFLYLEMVSHTCQSRQDRLEMLI